MLQIQQSDIVKNPVIHSGTPFDECSSGSFENPKITEDHSDSTTAQLPKAVPSLLQSTIDANSPLSLHHSTPNTVDKCPVGDGDNVQITASKEHISEVVPSLPSGFSNNDDLSCEDYIKNKYAINKDRFGEGDNSQITALNEQPSLPESTVNENSTTQSSCIDLSSKNPLQLSDNLANSTLTRLQFYDEDKLQITASKEQQPSEVAPSSTQSRIDVNSATHHLPNYVRFSDHDNSEIAASKDHQKVVSSLAQSTVGANPAIHSSLSRGDNLSYEETNTTPVDKAVSNDQCCDNSQITTSKEVPSLTESDDDLTCEDTFQVPGKLANSTPNIENEIKFGDDYNSQIIASKEEQRSEVVASLSQSGGDANSATQLALSCEAADMLQKIEKFAVIDQTSNNQVDECDNSQITASKEQPSEVVSYSTVDANSAAQSSLLLGSSDDVPDKNSLQITGQLVNSPLNTTENTSINDPDSAEAHNLQTSSSKEQPSGVLPLLATQSSLSLDGLSCEDNVQITEKLLDLMPSDTGKSPVNDATSNDQLGDGDNSHIAATKEPEVVVPSLSLLACDNYLQITEKLVNSIPNSTDKSSIDDPTSNNQRDNILNSDEHINSYISSETLQIISSLEEILD